MHGLMFKIVHRLMAKIVRKLLFNIMHKLMFKKCKASVQYSVQANVRHEFCQHTFRHTVTVKRNLLQNGALAGISELR